MTHLDSELQRLKDEIREMSELVRHQLKKSIDAFLKLKKDIAKEVIFQERRVNAEELKIDRDCENIMALFNPVAVDLRFVFAAFKINSHFERMGDHAKGISYYTLQLKKAYDPVLLSDLRFNEMVNIIDRMIASNQNAFDNNDTMEARKIFETDDQLDELNGRATLIIAHYIQKHSGEEVVPLLNLMSVVRKLERIGDLNKNIAEEIIFFVEANVLKHENEKI